MSLTPADPTAWGLPAGAVEVTSLRGRDHKTFAVGPNQYVFKGRHFSHYQLSDGSWDDSDLTFQPSGSDRVVTRNQQLHAAVRAGGGLEVTTPAGVGVRWLTPQQPITSGNRAVYSDGTLQWSYEVGPRQVKHSATVAARRGPQSYQFTYQLLGGAQDWTVDSGGNLVSASGLSVPRATIYGADGSLYQAGPWQMLAGPRVAFSWDDSALPASAFPYQLDPTTSISEVASADDGYAEGSGGTYAFITSGSLQSTARTMLQNTKSLVSTTYYVDVSALQFDTSPVGSGTITSASLNLTEVGAFGSNYAYGNADSRNLVGEYYAASNWPLSASIWTKSVGSAAFTVAVSSFTGTSGNAVTVALTSPDSNINKSGYTGFRTGIDGGTPTGKNSVVYGAFDNSTSANRPTLSITYSTNPAISGTGYADTSGSRGTLTTSLPLSGSGGLVTTGSSGTLLFTMSGSGGLTTTGGAGSLSTSLPLAGTGGLATTGGSGLLTLLLTLAGSGGLDTSGSSGSPHGMLSGSGYAQFGGTLLNPILALIQWNITTPWQPDDRLLTPWESWTEITPWSPDSRLITPWESWTLTTPWPALGANGEPMAVASAYTRYTGDDLDVYRPVPNIPSGATITSATLLVKANLGDLDVAARLTKTITTSSVSGTGQITDGGSSGTGQLYFQLTNADTTTLGAGAWQWAVKVTLSNGRKQTIEQGSFTLLQSVVRG